MKRAILAFCWLFLVSGCSTLNGSVPFRYVPSLNTMQQNDAVIGMDKFADSRPADDKEVTKAIPDIDEKVTSKVLEDLRSSGMFARVDFTPRRDKEDLVIKGEIKRFYWKTNHNPIKFIPIIGQVLLLLGITSYNIEAVVELKVQILDARTGAVLSEYDKTSTKTDSATLYDNKSGESGAELAEAFREVVKQIKDGIAGDVQNGKIGIRK
ncbi:MAG: hypothetical protein ABSG75_12060 [Syntrophales bacterium]|jgi:hypothetical protein